jgi:hypothetical protein
MDNLLTRQIPVYKVYFGWLGILLFFSVIGYFFHPHYGKKRARGVATETEIRLVAISFDLYMKENGKLPVGNNVSITSAFSDIASFSWETNRIGETVDAWKTPLQIQVFNGTNFLITSAGRNKIFGDLDDIVFNSASNGFVKP